MDEKQAYEQKLQAQLDQWSAEIDKLKAKAAQAEADLKLEYQQNIEALSAQQSAAQAKLRELHEAGGDAWRDLQAGLESAWDALNYSVRSALLRFK